MHVVTSTHRTDIDAAFATLVRLRAGALLVGSDAFFLARREQIVALRHVTPCPRAMTCASSSRSGGLMSYGPSLPKRGGKGASCR